MKTVAISPWHKARQQAFAIARRVKDQGIRATARQARMNVMTVQRFTKNPLASTVLTHYQLASATGVDLQLNAPAAPARSLVPRQ